MGDVMYSAMQLYNNYLSEGKTDRATILKLDWTIIYILNIHLNKYTKTKPSVNLIILPILYKKIKKKSQKKYWNKFNEF